MNPQPIDTARDSDLRLSVAALHRAARRAREVAQRTGTAIIISRDGVIQTISPLAAASGAPPAVQEPTAPYGGKS